MASFALRELAALIGGELRGDPEHVITGLSTLEQAGSCHLGFLANARYRFQVPHTRAGALLLRPDDANLFAGHALLVADPYAAFARLTHVFDPAPVPAPGVHARAVVAASAVVHPTASIAAGVVIEEHAQVAAHCVIGPNAVIGARVQLGEGCWIGPLVAIHHGCRLGSRVRVHAGAVIGAEGFGFAPDAGQWQRIAQIGTVEVGDDCRIGANTCIDRGAVGDTVIGRNVIIDNQVQIAHNVHIGDHTAIAACCGISGSTRIGRHCVLAGGVGLIGHIELADHVHITGMTMVTKSISAAGSYSSGTAMSTTSDWKKMAVQMRRLSQVNVQQWSQQLADMQARLNRLESRDDPATARPGA